MKVTSKHWLLLGCGTLLVLAILVVAFAIAWRLTEPPEVAGLPTVIFNSPRVGEQVQVGQEVIVQATATDPVGVTRVEFLVNGALYGSEASPIPQGQSPFISRQSWRASTPGTYTLIAKAYNAAGGVSQPEAITIQVVEPTPTAMVTPVPGEPTTTPTATATPEEPTPIVIVITPPAPQEPSCTNGSQWLRVRKGPGMTYEVIGSLKPDQTVAVTGQNSGWWQIAIDMWVSGGAGYCQGNAAASTVPVVPAPPTPTPTFTLTPTPSPTATPTLTPTTPITQTLPWWINGHVSDFTGGPIGGVQVTCWRATTTEEVLGISVTNDQGGYDMVKDFPDTGGLRCEAQKGGYQPAERRYEEKSERNNRAYKVDFVLATAPTTTRTVRIELTNGPLGGPEEGLVAFTVGNELGDSLTREIEVGPTGTWQGTIEVPSDRLESPLKFHAEHQPTLYFTEEGESQVANETYEIRLAFRLIPPASGQNKGEWALPIVAEYIGNPSWQNLYIPKVVGTCYRQLPDGTQEVWLQFMEGMQGVNHILKPDGTRQKDVEQSPKPPWCPSPMQGGRYSNIGMGAFYVPQVPWTTVFTYWIEGEEWYWKSYNLSQ